MSRDSQLRDKKIASTVLIDTKTGDIEIDGVRLPWWFAAPPTVETNSVPGRPVLVTLSLHVDVVTVANPLESDMQEIRALGAREKSEAVKEFRNRVEGERVDDMRARMADKDARGPARQVFWRGIGNHLNENFG